MGNWSSVCKISIVLKNYLDLALLSEAWDSLWGICTSLRRNCNLLTANVELLKEGGIFKS